MNLTPGRDEIPSKNALDVSLTSERCAFIADQVRSGRFRTPSEDARAAPRLLEYETAGERSLRRNAFAQAVGKRPSSKVWDGAS
jgi:Arc/MetJ-type ribon-helix-helix transcriptional regulator